MNEAGDRIVVETEEYLQQLKPMLNRELNAEFRRINKLQNETGCEYRTEFECLKQEAYRRGQNLPRKIEYKKVYFPNNDKINWIRYNFVDRSLFVNYKLSDVIYMYGGVSRKEFEALKVAKSPEKYLKGIIARIGRDVPSRYI